MPRGYLKHKKGVSKHRARGGASGQGYDDRCDKRCYPLHEPPSIRETVEYFVIDTPNILNSDSISRKACSLVSGECTICFKDGPIIDLSKKCKWHDAACHDCLRRIFVTEAQKSTKKYPLMCFNPLCNQPVHAAQLEKYSIFETQVEAKKHHDMLVLSKIEKNDGMKTVHCPKCDTPRGVGKLGDKNKIFGCRNCKCLYLVSPSYATIRALENMKSDKFGANEGWAHCPSCNILISKGDGCEHMVCLYCDHEFYWDECQEKKDKIPHARVPDGEIYRWW